MFRYAVGLVALAALVGSGCTSVVLPSRHPTRDLDGALFTEQMLHEAEYYKMNAALAKEHRDVLEMRARYQIPYLKAFLELEERGALDDPNVPVERYALPMGVIDAVNVGLHLFDSAVVLGPLWMSFVSFDTSRSLLRRHQRISKAAIDYPNLRFYTIDRQASAITDKTAYEARIEALFDQANQFVRDEFPLPCVYARRYANTGFGKRAPGVFHSREYICTVDYERPRGPHDRDVTVMVSTIHDARRMNLEEVAEKRDLIGMIHLYTWRWRDYQDYRRGDAAVRLFAAARERMPEGWYAVFSGPDGQGRWKVFVSDGERTVAFDPPPEKRRGGRGR